jgi:pimeloyl-ACP methyl ester carboxylesterase
MVHPLSSAVVVLLAVVAYQYWITDHVEVSQYDNIQQWRLRGSYFRNPDGYLVFYVDETNPTSSTPETLLLVHGYPTCSFDWLKVWPQLATRFSSWFRFDIHCPHGD